MKIYILSLVFLALILAGCNKDKNKTVAPPAPANPSTMEYMISDSAYGTNNWVTTDKPLPAIYDHYPYNKSESIYFDTGGSRKFCIVRLDTFDRYFAGGGIQSYRVQGYSRSFYTFDSSYNGTPTIRISFKEKGFTLYSGVELPHKTKSFVLTGTKK